MNRIRRHLTYANVMSTIAVFLVLGGTVYAAAKINGSEIKRNSIPGNRVKRHSLTKAQINRAKLGTVPLAKTANPIAFAHISASGVIGQGRSKGTANATVSNPQQGVYCLRGLGFAFKGAQVTADFDDSSGQIATQFGSTVPSTCSPQADAYVATVGSDDLGKNAGFFIVFYN
jgi:hypothetical protein